MDSFSPNNNIHSDEKMSMFIEGYILGSLITLAVMYLIEKG